MPQIDLTKLPNRKVDLSKLPDREAQEPIKDPGVFGRIARGFTEGLESARLEQERFEKAFEEGRISAPRAVLEAAGIGAQKIFTPPVRATEAALEPITEAVVTPVVETAVNILDVTTGPLQGFFRDIIGEENIKDVQRSIDTMDEETKRTLVNAAKTIEAITAPVAIAKAPKLPGVELVKKATKEVIDPAKVKISDLKSKLNIKEGNSLAFKAVKPRISKKRSLPNVKKNFSEANKAILEEGFVPNDLATYAGAIKDTKKAVWNQIQSRLDNAGVDAQVDLNIVANNIRNKVLTPNLERINPSGARQVDDFLNAMVSRGEKVNVLDAEEMKQLLNAEVGGLFGEITLPKPLKDAKKKASLELGTQLDNLLSKTPGEFSKLKKKYGALADIDEDVFKRIIVFERANPESLFSGLGKLSGFADLLSFDPTKVATGITKIATGIMLKRKNDANLMIKKAFNKLKKSKLVR